MLKTIKLSISAMFLFSPFLAFAADSAEALKQVDREFAIYAAKHGNSAAFEHYAASGSIMFRRSWEPAKGPKQVAQIFAGDNSKLTWEPVEAHIAASGDLGYTWGRWQSVSEEKGVEKTTHGKYVTIWQKQEDGSWRFVLDTGSPNDPPPPAEK